MRRRRDCARRRALIVATSTVSSGKITIYCTPPYMTKRHFDPLAMFSSLGLFRSFPCPRSSDCSACPFSHPPNPPPLPLIATPDAPAPAPAPTPPPRTVPAKRPRELSAAASSASHSEPPTRRVRTATAPKPVPVPAQAHSSVRHVRHVRGHPLTRHSRRPVHPSLESMPPSPMWPYPSARFAIVPPPPPLPLI